MPNRQNSNVVSSIGETLKQARTKAGLSVADVAAKLHLSARYIEGIETDDLISLPQSLIFKRGYIRSYARMLKIPDENIQQLLHAQGLIEVPVVKKINLVEKQQITVNDKRVRYVTYGIVLLFIILLISWWRLQVSEHHRSEVKAPVSTEVSKPAPVVAETKVEPKIQEVLPEEPIINTKPPADIAKNDPNKNTPPATPKKRSDVASDIASDLNFDSGS